MSELAGWAVLFDWNGTLVDDTERARLALNAVLRRRGRAEMDARTFARRFELPLRALFTTLGVDDPTAAEAEWNELMGAETPSVRDDSADALRTLRSLGAQVGVVSAAAEVTVRRDLHDTGIGDLLDIVVGGASDKAAVLTGLVSAGHAVYVGDTDYDIRCGREAGCVTIALTDGYQAPELVRAARPDHVLGSLAALAPTLLELARDAERTPLADDKEPT